jgi:hypothetical protein
MCNGSIAKPLKENKTKNCCEVTVSGDRNTLYEVCMNGIHVEKF